MACFGGYPGLNADRPGGTGAAVLFSSLLSHSRFLSGRLLWGSLASSGLASCRSLFRCRLASGLSSSGLASSGLASCRSLLRCWLASGLASSSLARRGLSSRGLSRSRLASRRCLSCRLLSRSLSFRRLSGRRLLSGCSLHCHLLYLPPRSCSCAQASATVKTVESVEKHLVSAFFGLVALFL